MMIFFELQFATFLLVALSCFPGTSYLNVVQGFTVTSSCRPAAAAAAAAAPHLQQRRQPHSSFASSLLRASSSATTTTTTKTKTRKKASSSSSSSKTKKTKRARGGRRGAGGGERIQAISEQELVDHVSSMYMQRPEQTTTTTTANTETAASSASSAADDAGKRLSRFPALLLNADYQPMSYLPLSLWNWQDAIKAVFSGKVTVVDVYPDTVVRAASLEIPLPSVIALNEYVPHQHIAAQHTPAFTRRNVFLRDGYQCQYCARHFHTRDLSLDHVVPRSRGGRLQWTNAVTCCRRCNGRKGSLLPDELAAIGMKLHKPPRPPSQHQLAQRAGTLLLLSPRRRHVHPTWKPYLGAVAAMAAQPQQQPKDDDDEESGDD